MGPRPLPKTRPLWYQINSLTWMLWSVAYQRVRVRARWNRTWSVAALRVSRGQLRRFARKFSVWERPCCARQFPLALGEEEGVATLAVTPTLLQARRKGRAMDPRICRSLALGKKTKRVM